MKKSFTTIKMLGHLYNMIAHMIAPLLSPNNQQHGPPRCFSSRLISTQLLYFLEG